MTETQPTKVYELAKELGIDSISLLDKLKGLNIQVKSHMSDLTPEEVVTARSGLGKRPAASAKTTAAGKKPATLRKKPAADAPAASAAETPAAKSASKTGAEETAAPKTVRTKAAPSKTTAAAAASTTPAASGATSAGRPSAVIRRRVKEDGATSSETLGSTGRSSAETHEAAPDTEEHGATETWETPAPAIESEESEVSTTTGAPETEEVVAAAAEETVREAETPEQTVQPTTTTAPSATPTNAAPVAAAPTVVTPANKRSVLKIVEAAAPPPRPSFKPVAAGPKPNTAGVAGNAGKSAFKGTTQQDKDGFRIIRMTKENLDQMVEEEAAKKRSPRELEIRPEDVKFADYRKKERVFLPKRKKIPMGKELHRTEITESKAQKRIVEVEGSISVQALANALSVKGVDVVKKLMMMGQMVTMNQTLDFDTASLVAAEYKYEARNTAFDEKAMLASKESDQDKAEDLQPRPPIVTIMGHVDHGKTTLLDSIREANVAAGEAGGITQHIGAYTIEKNGKKITFIDTPGHEAFTTMRARGANVTDLVIIVVSADDGVMPQTREAISHAQAAGVPIIVAVNKIDKPGANPEKIKQGLAELNLLAEDWGGQTMFVPVSALKKTNIDKLLEGILLQAEMLDLKANPNTYASGTVLEARLEKGRGPVASLLISRGTLRVGDPVVAGTFSGKVRALTDDRGRNVKEATPGVAVELLGLEGVPNPGEKFNTTKTEDDARRVAQNRVDQLRAAKSAHAGKITLDDLYSKIQSGEVKELPVILKADVFGSVEAIRESLSKLTTDKVKLKVIMASTGGITESDVLLASASGAIIIGFGVRPETKARQVAEAEHVEIKSYSIIYELIEDVKKAMTGLLEKTKVERFLGRAEVRQVFSVPKLGSVAGSAVVDGKILRGSNVRLLRDSRILFDGKMSSLRRFKDDVKEVATGYECGIGIENYNDIKVGDLIEAYQIDLIEPTL